MLIGLGALAAGGAAATGTGAFTSFTASRNANLKVVGDSNGLVGLQVGDALGAGEVVGTDGNGELEIDFSSSNPHDVEGGTGVNDMAKYQVGAMDDDDPRGDGIDFESIYDDDTNPSSAAGEGRPYDNGEDQSAFVVLNNSDMTIDLQIGYQMADDAPDPAGATIYLQGAASDISGTGPDEDDSELDGATAVRTSALDLDDLSDQQTQTHQALSFHRANDPDESIPSGDAVYVSIQVDTTDADTSGVQDLSGNLVINANKAASYTD